MKGRWQLQERFFLQISMLKTIQQQLLTLMMLQKVQKQILVLKKI